MAPKADPNEAFAREQRVHQATELIPRKNDNAKLREMIGHPFLFQLCEIVATSCGAHVSSVIPLMMCLCAGFAGHCVNITVNPATGWEVKFIQWVSVVAFSGTGKSPVMAMFTEAIGYACRKLRLLALEKDKEREAKHAALKRAGSGHSPSQEPAGEGARGNGAPTNGSGETEHRSTFAFPLGSASNRQNRRASDVNEIEDSYDSVSQALSHFTFEMGSVTMPSLHFKLCNLFKALGTGIQLKFSEELMEIVKSLGSFSAGGGTDRTDLLQLHDRKSWIRETKDDQKQNENGTMQVTAECPQVTYGGTTQPLEWLARAVGDNQDGLVARFFTVFPHVPASFAEEEGAYAPPP